MLISTCELEQHSAARKIEDGMDSLHCNVGKVS